MSDSVESDGVFCPQCLRTLPASEFHQNKRRPDGLAYYYCKSCACERMEVSRRRRGIKPRRAPSVAVPVGMKWCPDCDEVKPISEFARTVARADGIHTYCKPCHNARGQETRERLYGGSREYHLRRRYRIGQEEFDRLSAEQGGVCAICSEPDPEHVGPRSRVR
jgi:hypothetical protein